MPLREVSCAYALAALGLLLAGLGGCMTPEKAERDADATAVALASSYWRAQTGVTNAFNLVRPRDALALRVALAALRSGNTNAVLPRPFAPKPFVRDTNGLVRLTRTDALRLGAAHNRKYQTLKETVYAKALAVDDQHHAFDSTFSGFILGALTGIPELDTESGEAGAGVSRKFEQGTTIAGNLAVDVAKMIRDDWHSFGWAGDLTVNIPLLRGSGRDIVREPLTQAERDLEDALRTFVRYRQTYALSVAKSYYNVLKYEQTHRNSGDNARRLEQNWNRAEMMFKAGRMDRIQTDQAKTDLLSARQTMITSRQSYDDALDDFRILLGFSPTTPFVPDDAELRRLEDAMADRARLATDALPDEAVALETAFTNRCDWAVVAGELADAQRKVNVAADSLRADLTLEGGAAYDADRAQHQNVDDATTTKARLKFSLPWDRRKERNAYRRALIARDQAARDLEEKTDSVADEVRAARRELVAARALYANKVEALKTARLRVEANDLFMQSGRSSMRDILEAESALLSARNSLCSAVIEWWTGDVSLAAAMGTLRVTADGTWEEEL